MKSLVVAFALVTSTAVADPHAKPTAPVDLRLESKPVAGGYQVTLIATPSRAVPAIELRLAGKTQRFAATLAGQARQLAVTVPVSAVAARVGVDVAGAAVVGRRSRATVVRLGAARKPEPPAVLRTLPDGRTIAEVR